MEKNDDKLMCYKAGALVTGAVEACKLVNMDLENLYDGFYTIQLPVVVEGRETLLEVRFQKMVKQADSFYRVPLAANLTDLVYAASLLGEMVRIRVDPAHNESFDERVARRLGELDITDQLHLLEMLDGRALV